MVARRGREPGAHASQLPRQNRTHASTKQLSEWTGDGFADRLCRRRGSSVRERKPTERMCFEKRLLGPGLRCVLAANNSDKAEFRHASEHLGCNIRTARVVAEIFGEQFFAPVWSLEARLDRCLRNGEIPQPNNSII